MAATIDVAVHDCRVTVLARDDRRLPACLLACRDYFLQHHGILPGADALAGLIADVAPDKQAKDVTLLGVSEASGSLVGIVLLIRDWDRRRQWCLRVMMLVPERRGSGLGAALYDRVSAWAKSQGAAAMLVGVMAANDGAVRFWQRLGFQEIRRQHVPDYGDAMDLEHRFVASRLGDVSRLGSTLQRQGQATGPLDQAPLRFGAAP